MEAATRKHDIQPAKDTCRTESGSVANLLSPFDYPVTAECLVCGQPIRCKRMYFCEWEHTNDHDPR